MTNNNVQNIKKAWPVYLFLVALMISAIVYYKKNPPDNPNKSLKDSITKNLDPYGLKQVINSRRGWDPAFSQWWGQQVDDFTVNDINGNSIQLNSLKGKNVILVFWATWCPPCNQEIPHLKKLRQQFPEDQLEIIAISNETEDVVSSFSKQKKLNYSVVAQSSALPKPLSQVSSIPTAFYINKDGKLSLATIGVVEHQESINILNAINSAPTIARTDDS